MSQGQIPARVWHHRPAGGYLLIEVLFWLALLGVFGLVAGRLFHFSFRVLHQSAMQSENTTRFEAVVQMMRSDVSAATTWEALDARTLTVRGPDGEIRWRAGIGGEIVRSAGSETERRWDVGQAITFARDGELMLLQAGSDSTGVMALSRRGVQQ